MDLGQLHAVDQRGKPEPVFIDFGEVNCNGSSNGEFGGKLRGVTVVVHTTFHTAPNRSRRRILPVTGLEAVLPFRYIPTPNPITTPGQVTGGQTPVEITVVAVITAFPIFKPPVAADPEQALAVARCEKATIATGFDGLGIAFFLTLLNKPVATHGKHALPNTSVRIIFIPVVALFPRLLQAIVTDRRPTEGCAAIALAGVAIIAFLEAGILCLQIQTLNPIATPSDCAEVCTAVSIARVTIITSLKAGLAFGEIRAQKTIITIGSLAKTCARIKVFSVTIIAGFSPLPNHAIATARRQTVVPTAVGLDIVQVITFFLPLMHDTITATGNRTPVRTLVAGFGIAIVTDLVARIPRLQIDP